MMNTCLLCKEVQVSIIFEMKKNGLKAKKKKKSGMVNQEKNYGRILIIGRMKSS